jgi:hypothetical protein
MTTVRVHEATLDITFTTTEKVVGLVRDQRIPLGAIRSVEVVPDGLGAVRGIRAPGLALPGRRMVGTWRSRSGKALLAVRGGRPALRLTLEGHRYASVLVTAHGADELAAAVSAHTR